MDWQGGLTESDTSKSCSIKLFGWTRLSASWNAPDGVRFRVRDSSGRIVLEVGGDGSDSESDDRRLPSGTYRLTVNHTSPSQVTFDVRLTWQKGDG